MALPAQGRAAYLALRCAQPAQPLHRRALARRGERCCYNNALAFRGRRGLEIGCHYGWSTAHLVAAGLDLDVIDPGLGYPDQMRDVADSLARVGGPGEAKLWAGFSPSIVPAVRATQRAPWSFAFIDGYHEGRAPLDDAEAVIASMADDACVMFHDLISPHVAAGLAHFARCGLERRALQHDADHGRRRGAALRARSRMWRTRTCRPIEAAHLRGVPVLLEVNISGEAAKYGFAAEAIAGVCRRCVAYACGSSRPDGQAALDGGLTWRGGSRTSPIARRGGRRSAGEHAAGRIVDGHERRLRSGDRRKGPPWFAWARLFQEWKRDCAGSRTGRGWCFGAAQPGAHSNGIRGEQEGMLKVSVTQVAEKGKANKALVAVLSKTLGLRKSQVELLSGESGHQKRFLVRGITAAELAARIGHVLKDHSMT